MASLEAANTFIAAAEEEVECEEYELAERLLKEASVPIETMSQLDPLMFKSIQNNQVKILDMLKVVNSEKNYQQPSMAEATSPVQSDNAMTEAAKTQCPGRAENINIYSHIDNIPDLATQLAIECAEKPSTVNFQDIVGLDKLKQSIREKIIYRYELPELYSGNVKDNYQCYLFYGPPGVSKSAASKATINEVRPYIKNVYRVTTDIIHGQTWRGQTLKVIKALFLMMRQNKPSMLVIGKMHVPPKKLAQLFDQYNL